MALQVTHLATSLDGGAGIGLWRYHQALLTAGVNSRILVMNPPTGLESEIGKVHWRKQPLPLRIARRLGLALAHSDRYKRKIAALDQSFGKADYELFTPPFSAYCAEDHPWIAEADIINIHWVAGMLDWPRFFKKVCKPIVLTLHDQQPYLGGFHYNQDADANLHLAALENHFRNVKQKALPLNRLGVTANSMWNAREARSSGFFQPDTPIETIYYPLDIDTFSPRDKATARLTLGIPPNSKVIGFACENLTNKRKGFNDLISALAQLPKALRDQVTLLSFGRAPTTQLQSSVNLPWIHLGYLHADEDKVTAYAAMDIFAAPSHAEAFGLTALEATALGIPVVATRIGGLAEAVPYAVQPTPNALRLGLIELLSDPLLRERRSAEGVQLARERHAPGHIGRQLADFYRTLIK